MRLALVHKRYDRIGGAEWDCYELSRQLAARGHDVHLVVAECRVPVPPEMTLHRVPIVRTGRLAKLVSFAAAAPRVWRTVDADCVIGFGRTVGHDLFRASGGCHLGYLARVAAERGRWRAVSQRLSPYHRAMLAIERRQYTPGSYRKILAVSEHSRDEILRLYPRVPPHDVAVLHYGVDVVRFDPASRARHRADVRRELGIPVDQPVVLLVGSGFTRKGVDLLLAIWRRPPEGAALVVAGNDQHLGARRREAAALEGRVVFTGPRRDVERLYAAADLFTLPSIHEGCPVAILEALASGLPVVTSRATGAPELLSGPLAELVVDDPRDAVAVRGAIERGLDPVRGAMYATAARAVAVDNSLDAAVERIETWCRVIAAGKGRAPAAEPAAARS